jgi:hypothetical protein
MIPCKRPKVTVEPRTDSDTFLVRCHVPRCGFQYPQDLKFHALKSDADGMAAMHRQAHRAAVPETRIVKPMIDRPGYGAECACGWSVGPDRTRTDAQSSLDHHLSSAHGLVTS